MINTIELHRILDYNSDTGIFRWKINCRNQIKKGDIAGSFDSKGYIVIRIKRRQYKAHVLAWVYIHGYWPENDIDYINRIPWNNWITNLREVSRQCGNRNRGNPKNNTSGIRGTSWRKQNQKWIAYIVINKKLKCLGSFNNFEEAVCYRLAAEQCLNWSGCDSNSPAYQYVQRMLKNG